MLYPPTLNTVVAHKDGDFQTISDALDYAAQGETGLCFYDVKGGVEAAISYHQLREHALETALKLQSLGLKRGARVAIIAETSIAYFSLFYGCQYAGMIPCPMPYTIYMGGKAAYLKRIQRLAETSGISLICLPQSLETLLEPISEMTNLPTMTFQHIEDLTGCGTIDALRHDEPAYIQFSSGSTSEPKGIAVSQQSLSSNVKAILQQCIGIRATDRAFSWLPLYHDMGMVGFALAPLFSQTTVDYISPASFARSPMLWLDLMSRNGSTITFAPSFGYELAAKRYKQSDTALDLSAIRIAGIGGDMIRPVMLDSFTQIFSPFHFSPSAFTPSYGMAESTLLVSFAHGVVLDRVDAAKIEISGTAEALPDTSSTKKAKSFVICGKALQEHDIIIADETGTPIADRQIGHIFIRGPSLTPGYITSQHIPVIADHQRYLATGDLGYMVNGDIVITGRHKDMILFNGRNIWPQDLETAVTEISTLSLKQAAAFSIDHDDKTQIVILVEHPATDADNQRAIKSSITATIFAVAGISAQIELVSPRSLPYTSSGKLARSLAKQSYLAGHYSAGAANQS